MSSGDFDGFEGYHLGVAEGGEGALFVEDVCLAAAHACGEVASSGAEHDDAATGHVLAAVVAYALDNGLDAAVSDAEAFARDAANVGLAAGRAVEGDVADDGVFLWGEGCAFGRDDDHLPTR